MKGESITLPCPETVSPEVWNEVVSAVQLQLGDDDHGLSLETPLSFIDSAGSVELMMDIEDALGIELSNDEIQNWASEIVNKTVVDLAIAVEKNVRRSKAHLATD